MTKSALKKVLVSVGCLVVFLVAWIFVFGKFHENHMVLFPTGHHEVNALTDGVVGGFSTSELSRTDSVVSARVNIRSGMAYPYAGMGLNLLSVDNRPAADFFDFTRFDSMAVLVETGRMAKVSFRFMNNDPVYSRQGAYASYRPLVASVPVPAKADQETRIALSDFKVPEWWLAGLGLEEDDGLRYMQRGVLFEVYNGEGTLRGIPDEIILRSIRLWGENRPFKSLMYLALGLALIGFALSVYLSVRKPVARTSKN